MDRIRKTLHDILVCLPTLVLGGIGGYLLSRVDAPLPWFFGSLFVVAGANLLGWRIRGPEGSRQTGQILIGTTIGLYFTPAVALIVAAHLPWMVLAAIVAIALGGIGGVALRRFAGIDRAAAFFGSIPGGMAEMLALGDRFRADAVALTLSQLTRVTIVILSIPPALTYFGLSGDDVFVPLAQTVDIPWLILLMAGCASLSIILGTAGLPNAWMLGSAILAGTLTVFEITLSAMPRELLSVAQVLIGIALGQRFDRAALSSAPRVILGSAASTVVMMAASLALAALIAGQTGISVTAMIAATAPGGLAEMSLTAAVLNLGVPLVTAYHVIRIVMITVLTLPAYRLCERLLQDRPTETA